MKLKTLSLLTILLILTLALTGCPNPTAAESKNADLKSLVTDIGTLTPVFDPAVTEYSLTVANSVTAITVSGTSADTNASVTPPVTLTDLVPGVAQTATVTVTAQDGTTKKSYTCVVIRESISGKAITSFTVPGSIGTTIYENTHTIEVRVPTGTSVIALIPTISHTGKSITPATGVANDFTLPQTYTVTAEDNSTQAYVVTVKLVVPDLTSLVMTLNGDDASLFKLSLGVWDLSTASEVVQLSPATWDILPDAYDENGTFEVLIDAFIDTDNDDVCDDDELTTGSWFTVTRYTTTTTSIELCKSIISVTVTGDPTIFTNPKLVNNEMQSGSSAMVVAPFSGGTGTIVTYGNKTGKSGYDADISAFADLNDNDVMDWGEYPISEENAEWVYAPTVAVSISLKTSVPAILPDGEKIGFATNLNYWYPSDLSHYRFVFDDTEDRVMFLIPAGAGTDGSFITCYQCETDPPRSSWHSGDHLWSLFDLVYAADSDKRHRVNENYDYQFVEWKQNIKDVVTYLETMKGFTVYGKDTLPASW